MPPSMVKPEIVELRRVIVGENVTARVVDVPRMNVFAGPAADTMSRTFPDALIGP